MIKKPPEDAATDEYLHNLVTHRRAEISYEAAMRLVIRLTYEGKRADAAEAERDPLRSTLTAVEALIPKWRERALKLKMRDDIDQMRVAIGYDICADNLEALLKPMKENT